MAARNSDSLINQGEFHARRPRDEPEHKGGHQLGSKASPSDRIPEFHVQTLPPGSAPAKHSFTPQVGGAVQDSGVDPTSQAPSAALDFPGATSADVHKGLGHPGQGQTSTELKHDGQHQRKNPGSGLVQHGATSVPGKAGVDLGSVNPRDDETQRALHRDEAKPGGRGPGFKVRSEDQTDTA